MGWQLSRTLLIVAVSALKFAGSLQSGAGHSPLSCNLYLSDRQRVRGRRTECTLAADSWLAGKL